ncbi:hypothetical protein OC844_004977 [Tilletia horrida]|nr:hypothetical protein OC844_004977 [Tilletia horrida]
MVETTLYEAERRLFDLWATYILQLDNEHKVDNYDAACRVINKITFPFRHIDDEVGLDDNAWVSFFFSSSEYRCTQDIATGLPRIPDCEYDVVQAAFQQLRARPTPERYFELAARFPSKIPHETRSQKLKAKLKAERRIMRRSGGFLGMEDEEDSDTEESEGDSDSDEDEEDEQDDDEADLEGDGGAAEDDIVAANRHFDDGAEDPAVAERAAAGARYATAHEHGMASAPGAPHPDGATALEGNDVGRPDSDDDSDTDTDAKHSPGFPSQRRPHHLYMAARSWENIKAQAGPKRQSESARDASATKRPRYQNLPEPAVSPPVEAHPSGPQLRDPFSRGRKGSLHSADTVEGPHIAPGLPSQLVQPSSATSLLQSQYTSKSEHSLTISQTSSKPSPEPQSGPSNLLALPTPTVVNDDPSVARDRALHRLRQSPGLASPEQPWVKELFQTILSCSVLQYFDLRGRRSDKQAPYGWIYEWQCRCSTDVPPWTHTRGDPEKNSAARSSTNKDPRLSSGTTSTAPPSTEEKPALPATTSVNATASATSPATAADATSLPLPPLPPAIAISPDPEPHVINARLAMQILLASTRHRLGDLSLQDAQSLRQALLERVATSIRLSASKFSIVLGCVPVRTCTVLIATAVWTCSNFVPASACLLCMPIDTRADGTTPGRHLFETLRDRSLLQQWTGILLAAPTRSNVQAFVDLRSASFQLRPVRTHFVPCLTTLFAQLLDRVGLRPLTRAYDAITIVSTQENEGCVNSDSMDRSTPLSPGVREQIEGIAASLPFGLCEVQSFPRRRIRGALVELWSMHGEFPPSERARFVPFVRCLDRILCDIDGGKATIADTLFYLDILRGVDSALPSDVAPSSIQGLGPWMERLRACVLRFDPVAASSLLRAGHGITFPARSSDDTSRADIVRTFIKDFSLGSMTPATAREATPVFASASYADLVTSDGHLQAQHDEVDQYLSDLFPWPVQQRTASSTLALLWWERHSQELPALAGLARCLLALPPSCATVDICHTALIETAQAQPHLHQDLLTSIVACRMLLNEGYGCIS